MPRQSPHPIKHIVFLSKGKMSKTPVVTISCLLSMYTEASVYTLLL